MYVTGQRIKPSGRYRNRHSAAARPNCGSFCRMSRRTEVSTTQATVSVFLLALTQFRKHLIGAALRKTMLFGKVQSCKRIGFSDRAGFDDKTTLRFGDFLPKHGLTGHKMHVTPQFGGNGDLSTFGNSGAHMIKISCKPCNAR